MTKQADSTTALTYLRSAMIAAALTLPLLSLTVFGTIWLWQNGYLLLWGISAFIVTLSIYGLERWVLRLAPEPFDKPSHAAPLSDTQGRTENLYSDDDAQSPEDRARTAIRELSQKVDPSTLTSRDAVLQLGIDVVAAVAAPMNPGQKDPHWKFTVPEALVLIERVSSELNESIRTKIPLADRLTVGQLLAVYRWRSVIPLAEKAYDLWRIVRVINPANAVTGELRDKVSSQLLEGMRTEIMKKIARLYVKEVGRAAIDLYSGRLKPKTHLSQT